MLRVVVFGWLRVFAFGILIWINLVLCWIGLVVVRFLAGFLWCFCDLVDLPFCFCLVLYQGCDLEIVFPGLFIVL